MAKTKTKTKKSARVGRTVQPAARVLSSAADFRTVHKTHRVPLGDGAVALMRDPTLAELENFESICEAERPTAEDISTLAQALVVDESGKLIFETTAAACDALSVGQLHTILAAVEKLKDPASAEKN